VISVVGAALKVTCPKDVAVTAGRGLSSARVRWSRADFRIHSNHRIKYETTKDVIYSTRIEDMKLKLLPVIAHGESPPYGLGSG